ncbi:EAL domain-containing protein (putative c-di-GMP-specific phosphodiesterase class I) [Paenibacillus shirakamiensis]|uniref:EAL domain-containing protein (Putative c-di-GMP-specific phosphodiesterase class I) n=1 Tax=Paenibacillus shirakamiensis TaxID=1265935 RepID=A0ABS4JLZ4_9BACL|nr:EAL domain-containing protein [Paenibacillus shirakamiensis]MBP2001599.1 EAL domain-containing protein (putative c-di-GMP-specific phosphodiesterase class I) [Paenibacillus shirakamiensis]
MICGNCREQRPMEDQGILSLRGAGDFIELIRDQRFDPKLEGQDYTMNYRSKDELLQLFQILRYGDGTVPTDITMRLQGMKDRNDQPVWIPLPQMEARLKHHNIVDIIVDERFTSHMQPIVNHVEEIVGFEFLLRPSSKEAPFQPLELFDIARETGLHSFLDRAARLSAIETSAMHIPKGIKRFINFLPSSIYNPKYCLTHTFDAIQKHALDPQDFVFEVVETEQIHKMDNILSIFDEYRKNGISVALDDVGAGYSTLEEMIRLRPDYVKIDRSLVDGCSQDMNKQRQIQLIIERAQDFGGQVLAEGIEDRQDFEFCRTHGALLAQGYLFGKPAPTPPDTFMRPTA